MESYLEIPFFAVDRYNSYRSDGTKATIKIQDTWLEYLSTLRSPFTPAGRQAATTRLTSLHSTIHHRG
jgi:hypothetical protein